MWTLSADGGNPPFESEGQIEQRLKFSEYRRVVEAGFCAVIAAFPEADFTKT